MKALQFVTLSTSALLFAGVALANTSGMMKHAPHTNIIFNEGSTMLSDADKKELRDLVSNARTRGKIDQVVVAAWADTRLPRQDEKVSDAARDLADKRATTISEYLKKELSVDDVEKYNMAETSNWLARTFNTKDAELKSVFSKKGADMPPVTNAEYRMIRQEGAPSKAVIVVEYEK